MENNDLLETEILYFDDSWTEKMESRYNEFQLGKSAGSLSDNGHALGI